MVYSSPLGGRRGGFGGCRGFSDHLIADADVIDESAEGVQQEGAPPLVVGTLAYDEVGAAVRYGGAAHAARAYLHPVEVERGGVGALVHYRRHGAPLSAWQLLRALNGHQEPCGRAVAQPQVALRRQLQCHTLLGTLVQVAADGGVGGCGLGHVGLHHGVALGGQHHAQRQRVGAPARGGHGGAHVGGIAVEAQCLAVGGRCRRGRQRRCHGVACAGGQLADAAGGERHVEVCCRLLCADGQGQQCGQCGKENVRAFHFFSLMVVVHNVFFRVVVVSILPQRYVFSLSWRVTIVANDTKFRSLQHFCDSNASCH